ncbi:MAG: type II toxin-antitoxin system RelE/ParE family toxin [ANME-2 cluster archaeon]|nr:type II toxin-antitoxin system RelE/ParE family toxin [ANME-2 cluster archaeon]
MKYTKIFKKQIENVNKKNKELMKELMQKVKKLYDTPYSGKPLKYRLSNYRSLRVKGKYRLIYMVDENEREVTLPLCEGTPPPTPQSTPVHFMQYKQIKAILYILKILR